MKNTLLATAVLHGQNRSLFSHAVGCDAMSVLIAMLSVSVAFIVALFVITQCFQNDWALPAWLLTALTVYIFIAPQFICWFAATMFVTGLSAHWPAKPFWTIALATLGVLIGHAFHLQVALVHVTDTQARRSRLSAIPLVERLHYETDYQQEQRDDQQIQLSNSCEDNLQDVELFYRENTFMADQLANIHNQNEWEVGLKQKPLTVGYRSYPSGFRFSDMKQLDMPQLDNVGTGPATVASTDPPNTLAFTMAHFESRDNFLDPVGMGWFQSRDHVVGFQPHHFDQRMDFEVDRKWLITRLELVSLRKHDEPLVYVSDRLPDMEELAEVPTRPLTPFESSALEKLRTEQDVVIQKGVNTIRMLGSLRAATSCLNCHSVQRGELLGAFSYDVSRVTPVREPQPPKTS